MSETYITCPYNPSHQILPHRYAVHITKCAVQHPDIKLLICPFNSKHRLREEEMAKHKIECPDRVTFEKKMNPIDVGASRHDDFASRSRSRSRSPLNKDSDEDNWDDEVGSKPSFHAENTKLGGLRKKN
ncbi:gametocyte-specific factor 1-like [Culicoides brevitarsis]|uniref:gametocyte-specific factor 1-like n=1 Tax=Culicoides brevitarsis TaxID=469753 RepID=UPI00307B16DE